MEPFIIINLLWNILATLFLIYKYTSTLGYIVKFSRYLTNTVSFIYEKFKYDNIETKNKSGIFKRCYNKIKSYIKINNNVNIPIYETTYMESRLNFNSELYKNTDSELHMDSGHDSLIEFKLNTDNNIYIDNDIYTDNIYIDNINTDNTYTDKNIINTYNINTDNIDNTDNFDKAVLNFLSNEKSSVLMNSEFIYGNLL